MILFKVYIRRCGNIDSLYVEAEAASDVKWRVYERFPGCRVVRILELAPKQPKAAPHAS